MLRDIAIKAFKGCCEAVSPGKRVAEVLKLQRDTLSVNLADGVHSINLTARSTICIVAFGKASVSMAEAAEDVLGTRCPRGVIIAPNGSKRSPGKFGPCELYCGARNNLPDEDSVEATRKALQMIGEYDQEDNVLLFLISGGGSALFCQPVHDVTLAEKLETIRILVKSAATIQQLNTVRQALSAVKGGRTAAMVKRAKVLSLIMSDVIGDPIPLIASGPTAEPSSLKSARDVITELGIDISDLPTSVRAVLDRPPAAAIITRNTTNLLILNNEIALNYLENTLAAQGFQVRVVTRSLDGLAETRGYEMADLVTARPEELDGLLRRMLPNEQQIGSLPKTGNVALLFGGETTVELHGKHGKGGRNQHLVLAALKRLREAKNINHKFLLLSAGTDGVDGPTNAAGAVITDADLLVPSPELENCLLNCDSHTFWHHFNDNQSHIITHPTGTNVMDVQIILLQCSA